MFTAMICRNQWDSINFILEVTNDENNKKIWYMFMVAKVISKLLDFGQSIWKGYSFIFAIFL